jgi:hypothetical protein
MGKRSDFERLPRDFYPTPYEAVIPLIPHLPIGCTFTEPCRGSDDLIKHLERNDFRCVLAYDVEEDATKSRKSEGDFFITNPPWDRKILHPIIENLSDQLPTWLLFDADWIHTKQSVFFLPRLKKIVSIGRVKWFPESKMTGKDNCAWYLFDKSREGSIEFVGRYDQRNSFVREEGTAGSPST